MLLMGANRLIKAGILYLQISVMLIHTDTGFWKLPSEF